MTVLFLIFFSKKKHHFFGIDPSAKVFKDNYKKNINIVNDFFSKKNLFSYLNKKNNKEKIRFNYIICYVL